MKLSDQNILFFTRTMKLGGTENVILQLCEIFKPLVHNIVVCSCGGVNVKKLSDMGITHYEILDLTIKRPKEIFQVCCRLRKIIHDEKITVVHSHHRMAALYANLIAPKKIIKIANAHNTFYDKKKLTKIAYKNTKIITVGEMVKKNLVEYFKIPQKQITVIHNAVKEFKDPIVKDERIEELHKQGYFVVGNVGRLSEQKGMEYYLRAISKVIVICPETRFVIVGTGEDEQKLLGLARKLKIEDYLLFMGYRSDIQNLMKQLDLIVLSSLWEGLPLTPIEAFSVSKTIVATAVDGTIEIVKSGENGYLVEPKNSDEIADKIVFLIEHPELMRKLEKNARDRYITEFSFEKLKERYIQLYEWL